LRRYGSTLAPPTSRRSSYDPSSAGDIRAHRSELAELVERFLEAMRRTEEDARSGVLRRDVGYPRAGLELSSWTRSAGLSEPVLLGLHDPTAHVRDAVERLLSSV
jgi:hypothetical protein